MPYSPPSSAFTAVDVPLFRRGTPGDHSTPASTQSRHTRTPSASMLNFSTERGPGAHKPLRGLPRRAKPSPAPVVTDPSSTTTPDASTPRSMAAFGPPTIPRSARGRPKFSVGDDDSSESASNSPKGSPSGENGPNSKGQWTSASTASKGLSIDTSSVYKEETPSETVPFPLLSPEPIATEPPVRRAAIVPLGSFAQIAASFNNTNDDDMPTPRSLPTALPAADSPVPALLSPRLLPVGGQKNLSLSGSGHGRSASMADFGGSRRTSPPASGTTTPVIRKSNGQPLKPSLKSSMSSPNISSMNEPRRIAKSAPTTPRVHFKELGLESVVLFDKGARPITVSGEYTGADDTETETETETGRGFPFPNITPPTCVRLAPTTSQLAFQPPPHSHVHLQYLSLPAIRPPRLHGTVLVRNVAFGKNVVVRYTTDNWETASEINASYSSSLPPGIVPGSFDAPWDKFTFSIKLDDIERSLPDRTLFCVVKYEAHGAGEWWDNNNGENYRVEFERPESNGLGLESGPSKIGTGDQSSAPKSFNPLTYQVNNSPAPPAPTTKPRSYSTSVVAPPPPIKAPPAPLCNGPQPHLLSLRLSNYVSPSSNVPKAPALPKVEKKEEPRAVDSFSPPSSPEHVKRPLELPDNDFGVDFHHEPRDMFTPLAEPGPLKMPATITPPDSAHNSPTSSPPMMRKPLLPPSSLPQSTDNGLLSPTSSPSNSLLLTSPSSPQAEAGQAEKPAEAADKEQNSPSSPPCFLDQAYSELVSRVCFHHSSPGGTPPYGLGVTTSSPKGGSPAGSGANSPATTSRGGIPRGGSYVLGTPGTTPFIK